MQADPTATRVENGSTNPEKERKKQAMEKLCSFGIARRMRDQDLYHGRASDGGAWQVDPYFDNGGNATNNRNINSIAALNAGSQETARDFGIARAQRKQTPYYSVHKIVAENPDAYIIDADAMRTENYSDLQRQDIAQTIQETLPGLSDACVFSFQDGKSLNQQALRQLEKRQYHASEAPQIARLLNISEAGAMQIIGAFNASIALCHNPSRTLLRYVSSQSESPREKEMPINRDYIARWAEDMNIIGTCYSLDSATLGRELETYQFFSLDKIGTQEQMEQERTARARKLGRAAWRTAAMLMRNERERGHRDDVLTLLEADQFAPSRQVVEKAKEAGPRYRQLFESPCGVWEGYTLQQHTETALDIFDKSQGDKLPASLYTLGRIALVTHDLGKPIAAARGDKTQQHRFNASEASGFLRDIGCSQEMIRSVTHLITDGMRYVSDDLLAGRRDREKHDRAMIYCQDIAHEISNGQGADTVDAEAIYQLCRGLVTADGGAYSTYSTTREGIITHRNSGGSRGQFDPSFKAAGATKRNIDFK